VASSLSTTQRLVLRELARGNRLSMQRGSAHGTPAACWRQAPDRAPATVRRPTLRALIGEGYVTTQHDAGLFLPGQAYTITLAGRRVIGVAPPAKIEAILQEMQQYDPRLSLTTWQQILAGHLGPEYSADDEAQVLAAMSRRG
jgi:hypothetical protein